MNEKVSPLYLPYSDNDYLPADRFMIIKNAFYAACLGLLAVPIHSMANMRAADIYWESSSSTIKNPHPKAPSGIEVSSEILNIHCDEQQCQVIASYQISSSKVQPIALAFILPVSTTITAKINNQAIPTESTKAAEIQEWSLDPSDYRISVYDREINRYVNYEAHFSGTLLKGNNTVTVEYIQPLSRREEDFGYFHSGRYLQTFSYILAPLKQWKLADDFTLNISVRAPKKRPDHDRWSLFKRRNLTCHLDNGILTRQSVTLMYTATLDKNFPDFLICNMGDNDLLPRKD